MFSNLRERVRPVNLYAAALMLAVLAGTAAAQETGRDEASLPNFHRVNEHLYRGAQPQAGGVERLAGMGVKTIINLRQPDEMTRAEEAAARRAGLRYFNVPMEGFDRPTDEQVARVIALVDDRQNWPVFVHCHHGKDRTGTIMAVYRMTHDGWTSEEAKAEAKRYGMSRWQFKMRDYISDYYRDHVKGHPATPPIPTRVQQ